MRISKENIIGAIVAEDYRTAGIFEQAGIDFCCNGSRSIETACNEQKIITQELVNHLQETVDESPRRNDSVNDYKTWPLDLLADYIEKKHHRYVTTQMPIIRSFLEKIVQVHGARHPELSQIKTHFDACAVALAAHMKKEELMLFPFIRKMVQAKQDGSKDLAAPFGTVQNPIRMMMHEHDAEGDRFRKIKELSSQYTAPADGCSTYRAAFAAMQAFEEDLHLHIHLENNLLFPGSIEMERSFA